MGITDADLDSVSSDIIIKTHKNTSVVNRVDEMAIRLLVHYNVSPSEFRIMNYRQLMYWRYIADTHIEAEKRERKKAGIKK